MFRTSVFKLLNVYLTQQFLTHPSRIARFARPLLVNVDLFNGQALRHYAKGKNKIKEDKGKGKKKHIEINESSLGEVVNIEKLKSELDQSILKLKDVFISQLSLRSTTGAIDNLTVVFEDNKYPLMELGQVIRKNPKTVIIKMDAFPQAIPSVLKAIENSGMNLNPQQDGTTLFIPVPKVTKEHRENLSKNAKVHFIKCRDAIRAIQTKYQKSIKNQEKEGLAQDTSHQLTEQVKQLADKHIVEAEKMLELKQAELLGEA